MQEEKAMSEKFVRLAEVMKRLRAPDGCPWDREQDYMSLRRYIIEEAYELIQAIESENIPNMCEECGDLMLQVVFISCMAEERGDFTISNVMDGLTNKLVRRHPHVFGDISVKDSDDVLRNWEQIKSAERRGKVRIPLIWRESRAACQRCCAPTGYRSAPRNPVSTGPRATSLPWSRRWRRSWRS